MRRLFFRIVLFSIGLVLVFEVTIRLFNLTIEVPRRIIDESRVQKYKPKQKGKWQGGTHHWQINEYGWPGPAPESLDNLIVLIGDSHIENLMNPDDCHQAFLLKELNPEFNFLQMARAGASLIEFMEFAKMAEKEYLPVLQIVYVKDSDFKESIVGFQRFTDRVQVDLDQGKVLQGQLKSNQLKTILYNFKTLYFFYLKAQVLLSKKVEEPVNGNTTVSLEPTKEEFQEYQRLLEFIQVNYNLENKYLAFHPSTSKSIVKLTKGQGINIITFELNEGKLWSWSVTDDSHWDCYGHREAAKQLTEKIILSK